MAAFGIFLDNDLVDQCLQDVSSQNDMLRSAQSVLKVANYSRKA